MFDTNFLGHQPSGPTAFIFMLISKILSVIRADFYLIFSKFVSPDEESSAIGRRTDVNFEHCKVLERSYFEFLERSIGSNFPLPKSVGTLLMLFRMS